MRILIADDDPMYRRLLDRHVRSWGYEAVLAEDGGEAWRILQSPNAPRVAILDWTMPEMDGISICRRLRKAGPDMPFVDRPRRQGRHAAGAGVRGGRLLGQAR